MKTNKINQRQALLKVWKRISRYKWFVILSLLLAFITVVSTLYVPILIGYAIDYMIGAGKVDFHSVSYFLLKIGVIIAFSGLAQWLMNMINNKITYHVVRDIRDEAFKKIENLPLKYIDEHPHGEIVSKVITDVDQFADGMLLGFTQLFTGVITILGTLIFMFSINIQIAFVVVMITPLSLFVANFIAKKTYSLFRLQSETRAKQTALIDEMIGNQKVVKAFGHEEEAMKSFDEINESLKKCSLKATFYSSITNPSTRFVNSLVYAGAGLSGAIAAVSGIITVGGLSCFLSYATQYTKPFNEISGVITELQNSIACAARIFELIEEQPQVPENANAVILNHIQGNVSLNNVSFSYDRADLIQERKLIQNFNLKVKPGQRVAIVGPTGCGKTTIINLLMRFYDINSGSIQIEDTDIRKVTRKSLRSSYGMVLQDTWLKDGTIRENIVIGKPDATEEEVIDAAKAAHSHSFIKRLPKGYDTIINEEGGNLSQGQKQLLCITRIMLCVPPMLILDEATSSIDTRTEIKIQKAFARLMQGRTSFIVAHRLSTIMEADIILVMKDGNIIEQGNHRELLELEGFYSELYHSQFR